MAEFSALPLFTDALLADTGHLTHEEFGLYMRLLIVCWRSPECRIPNDATWISKRLNLDPLQYDRKIKPLIEEFFKSDGNWLTQKRLSKEFQYVRGGGKRSRLGVEGKEKSREDGKIRAARLVEARKKGRHTEEQWRDLVRLCGEKCVACGSPGPLLKDHIEPIYQGGSDGLENVQPLCRTCNSKKGSDKTDHRNPLILKELNVLQTCTPTPTPTPTKKETPLTPQAGGGKKGGVLKPSGGSGGECFEIRDWLSPEGLAEAKQAAPGWDIYGLAEVYNSGVKTRGIPDHPEKAFIAWCGKYTKGKRP